MSAACKSHSLDSWDGCLSFSLLLDIAYMASRSLPLTANNAVYISMTAKNPPIKSELSLQSLKARVTHLTMTTRHRHGGSTRQHVFGPDHVQRDSWIDCVVT